MNYREKYLLMCAQLEDHQRPLEAYRLLRNGQQVNSQAHPEFFYWQKWFDTELAKLNAPILARAQFKVHQVIIFKNAEWHHCLDLNGPQSESSLLFMLSVRPGSYCAEEVLRVGVTTFGELYYGVDWDSTLNVYHEEPLGVMSLDTPAVEATNAPVTGVNLSAQTTINRVKFHMNVPETNVLGVLNLEIFTRSA